jgi:phage repressor protein C with HTH and peptisase S24 domain
MKNSVKQRLKDYLEKSEVKDSDFCRAIGVSQGYISGMRTSIQPDKLKSIAINYPSLDIGWLLTGEGNMERPKYSASLSDDGIPLCRIEAVAGFGNDTFSISKKDIEALYKVRELDSANFMIYIRGDSMCPTYNNGDVIAVKTIRDWNFIQWGKPHLISCSEGLLVKRIYQEEGYIIAVSDNPTYRPSRIPTNEISGIALIIGCVKFEGY